MTDYNTKKDAFLADAKWKDGTAWGDHKGPELSLYDSESCCAYCADFAQYVYGESAPNLGAKFYNTSEIRTGDILHIYNGESQHWVVILERNGNTLYTAEGNVGHAVMVSTSHYWMNGSSLWNSLYDGNYQCELYTGYHHELTSQPTIANEGDLFEGYLIARKPWMHLVVNKDTGNVELEPNAVARRTAQGCWRFERQSDGSYIITSLYNGKVLDVTEASSADGTNVKVFTRWGDDNTAQRWYLCTDGTIATKIDPNKRLDVTGGIMSPGTNIQIFSVNGSDAQNIYPYNSEIDSSDPFPTGMTAHF